MKIANLIKKAQLKFENDQEMVGYFSPGRVNLIGEHIDYNGGYVMPCALDIGTYGFAQKRKDKLVRCFSENFAEQGIITFSLDELIYDQNHHWANYVKAILFLIKIPYGFNLYVKGEIPNGSGLSSSASLELLIGMIANDLYNLNLSIKDLVKIAHQAENDFINVKCGIMDQFIVAMGKANSALFLNTATLEFSYVDIDFYDYQLIIGNTNKKRSLMDSKYNERTKECEQGLKILQGVFNIKHLCDLNLSQLNKSLISDDRIFKRLRHVISENERSIKAYESLKKSDFIEFGKLLNQSHQSLKNDYEVTGVELDTLVDQFQKNGAIGARMTGAGFGGCMIALVKAKDAKLIIDKVKSQYQQITNIDADFYEVNISKGVYKL